MLIARRARHPSVGLAVALTVVLTVVVAGAAYAYGIQRHTVGGFDHGCGYITDNGCTGSNNDAGDYNRTGFIKDNYCCISTYYMNLEIWRAATNPYFVSRSDCSNCTLVIDYYDTNPTYECRYKTWHVAINQNFDFLVNGHWHWTEAATNSTGAC